MRLRRGKCQFTVGTFCMKCQPSSLFLPPFHLLLTCIYKPDKLSIESDPTVLRRPTLNATTVSLQQGKSLKSVTTELWLPAMASLVASGFVVRRLRLRRFLAAAKANHVLITERCESCDLVNRAAAGPTKQTRLKAGVSSACFMWV